MRLKIVSNRQIAEKTFSLRVDNPDLFDIHPGQFFMLKVNEFDYPLLRRPFSVADYTPEYIEIIYRVVGEGTLMLSHKKEGEFIDLLGPLGRGFGKPGNGHDVVLVGGGIGVAPLIYLSRVFAHYYGIKHDFFAGFNRASEIYFDSARVVTLDGSAGLKGSVVDAVRDRINEDSEVFACGPYGMLKALAYLCSEKKAALEVSLEARMACGIGVCLGCTVKAKDGSFKRVCTEGPVFDYREIEWL